MKSKFRRLTLVFLLLPALFILCFAGYDPCGIFWRREYKALPAGGTRIMAANAIDSGKFDSYILGTSMLQNTSAREAERLFNDGSRFANISMSGSNYFERSVVLRYIFYKNDGTRNIVYSLDSSSYINQSIENPEYPLSDFAYLYDSNRLNNIKFYFNMLAFKTIGKALIQRPNFSEGIYKDYDRPNAGFYLDPDWPPLFGGLDKWLTAQFKNPENGIKFRQGLEGIVRNAKIADATPIADVQFSEETTARIEAAREYCREYVIKFVEESPSTQFYVFFPPYSRIRFATMYQCDKPSALIHQHIVRYFAEMGAKYDNLHVFGFEDQDFLDDIALYRDTGHYHPNVNTLITTAMAEGTNLITPQNVDEYLREAELRALAFDLKGLGRQIDLALGEGQ